MNLIGVVCNKNSKIMYLRGYVYFLMYKSDPRVCMKARGS